MAQRTGPYDRNDRQNDDKGKGNGKGNDKGKGDGTGQRHRLEACLQEFMDMQAGLEQILAVLELRIIQLRVQLLQLDDE